MLSTKANLFKYTQRPLILRPAHYYNMPTLLIFSAMVVISRLIEVLLSIQWSVNIPCLGDGKIYVCYFCLSSLQQTVLRSFRTSPPLFLSHESFSSGLLLPFLLLPHFPTFLPPPSSCKVSACVCTESSTVHIHVWPSSACNWPYIYCATCEINGWRWNLPLIILVTGAM